MVYNILLSYTLLLLSPYTNVGIILIEFIQHSAHKTYHAFFLFPRGYIYNIKIHTFGSVRITYILFFIGVYYKYIVTL